MICFYFIINDKEYIGKKGIFMDFKKKEKEDENAYIWRICDNKDLIGTWQDVCNILNEELNHDYNESWYRKMYQSFIMVFDSIKQKYLSEDEINRLEEKKQETDDIIKAQQLILNNIINQNKYFDDYMKKIEKSSNKKRTIISSLSNLSKVILNFTISLLPISLFKNKLFGTLVSSIMINNSLKTMRRMLNPSLKIDYELFLDHYYNSKNILYDTYQMCNNSLQELTLLKEELLVFDQNDIKQLLIEINLIENNIKKQIKSLNIKKDNLEKIYIKVKKDNYRF